MRTILCKPNTINSYNFRRKGKTMKKTLVAGLAAVLFFLTSTGIAVAGDDAKNKTDSNNSKTTGLYDNVRILQEQINSLTERIGRIETLHGVGPRFTDMGDGTIFDNDSGLIWLKDASCTELAEDADKAGGGWSGATLAAAGLAGSGVGYGECDLTDGSREGDWRLPTKTEWEAFMSNVYRNPALVNTVGDAKWSEGDAFWRVWGSIYWSSTQNEIDESYAYGADMILGQIECDLKVTPNFIWPVRNDN